MSNGGGVEEEWRMSTGAGMCDGVEDVTLHLQT